MHATCSELSNGHRRRATIDVEVRPDRSTWDGLWQIYADAFEPLQELALLNHLYDRASFESLLDDERIVKLVARVGDDPVGLAMITNHLELVPQISPPFLRRRYPCEASRNAIFFGILVFVDESHRRTTTFARLVAGMGQITAAHGGVVVFDICKHNLDASSLDRQMGSIARWFPGSSFSQIDQQSYFAVALPRPAANLPVAIPAPAAADVVVGEGVPDDLATIETVRAASA